MALKVDKLRVIKLKSVDLVEDVKKNLGPIHAEIAKNVFIQLSVAIRNMDSFYLKGVGKWGPYRKHVKGLCDKGIIYDQFGEICKQVKGDKYPKRVKKTEG